MSARKKAPIYRGKRLDKPTRLKLLRATRELLATPGVWVRGKYEYRRRDGGVQYCLVGALNKTAADLGFGGSVTDRELPKALSLYDLAREKGFSDVENMNDAIASNRKRKALGKGVDGVLAFLDEKIAMEEAS